MSYNWNSSPLSEVIEQFIDYRGKTPNKTQKGIPLITAKIIKNGFILNTNEFIAESDYESWMRRGIPKYEDVVLTTEAPLGEVAQILTKEKIALAQRVITLRGKEGILDNTFLKYSLQSPKMQARLRERESGSTVTGIKSSELKKVIIDYPDFKIQQRISNILRFIDDKIQLNQKFIYKLEEVSQVIYKYWFHDFEFPNDSGVPFKSSNGKMVESELGHIPEGWEIIELKDITQMYKKTFNPKRTNETEVIHFSLPAFDTNQYPVCDEVATIKSNKWIIDENCVLFSKMNPITPRVWLPPLNNEMLNICSSEFVVLKNKSFEKASFIYNLCRSEQFTEHLIANATGSTNSRQRITPDNAMLFKFAFKQEIVEMYGEIVAPLMNQVILLLKENHKLENIRDSLLPKLLSGEIEIPDESVVK